MGHPTPQFTVPTFAKSPATGRYEGVWPYGNRPGVFMGPAQQGQRSSVSVSVSSGAWQLPSGHFIGAKRALQVVYPRPDTETNSWARHRKAYFDGVNSLAYNIPIGVSFGSPPYYYRVLAAPVGVGEFSIGQIYGSTNYGRLIWTPTASVSTPQTVTVRVTDQQLNYVDVTWTVRTSASVSDFLFFSQSGGNDTTGTGAINSPFATVSKAVSLSTNALGIFRAGVQDLPSSTPIMTPGTGVSGFVGFEGESVTFNFSTMSAGHGPEIGVADFYADNLVLSGGSTSATNWRSLWMGGPDSRQTFSRLTGTAIVNGSVGNDNPTLLFFAANPTNRSYTYIVDCAESGRPVSSGGNEAGLFIWFSVSNGLHERNLLTNSSAGQGNMLLKAACFMNTGRHNFVGGVNAAQGYSYGSIDGTVVVDPGDNEWCYNTVVGSVFSLNYDNLTTTPKNIWVYRNTIYNTQGQSGAVKVNSYSGNGPFVFEDNVLVYGTGATPFTSSSTLATVTNTGTECQGVSSAGIINTSTYQLAGAYASNYLGRRGAQIA